MEKNGDLSYQHTNGVSLPLKEPAKQSKISSSSAGLRSPRAPPLISKFRGELPPTPQTVPSANAKYNGIFFSPTGCPAGSRAPYYIIHPEWASEQRAINKLDPANTFPATRPVSAIGYRKKGVCGTTATTPSACRGILPIDRGGESVLSTARRAASHNPVWPHRCKSAPAQKSRNPISWV